MSKPPSPPVEPATYKVSEAATRAGVCLRTIWRWIDSGKVPGVLRRGKVVRINRRLFEEWLENGDQ